MSYSNDTTMPSQSNPTETVVNFNRDNQTVSTDRAFRSSTDIKSSSISPVWKCLAIIFGACVLALGAFVVYDKLGDKDTEIPRSNTEPYHSALKETQPFVGNRNNTEILTSIIKEEYRLTPDGLSWKPEQNYPQRFSEPIYGRLCVKITQAGDYELYSKMTLKYHQAFSIFHSLRHTRLASANPGLSRGLMDYVVEKNNFQWDPPMSGRVPSILDTVGTISARPGDSICVETEHRKDIYVSRADNKFIITKIGGRN